MHAFQRKNFILSLHVSEHLPYMMIIIVVVILIDATLISITSAFAYRAVTPQSLTYIINVDRLYDVHCQTSVFYNNRILVRVPS